MNTNIFGHEESSSLWLSMNISVARVMQYCFYIHRNTKTIYHVRTWLLEYQFCLFIGTQLNQP